MKKLYLISYDIQNDSLRAKVRRKLIGFSSSYQKSCFECRLSFSELTDLRRFFTEVIKEDSKLDIFEISDEPKIRRFLPKTTLPLGVMVLE